jgi:type IV pilus assembly protein PilB
MNKRIGDILVDMGAVSREQVEKALVEKALREPRHTPPPKKKRLGEILVEMGAIARAQVEKAAQEAEKTNSLLGQVLLRLDWISEGDLQKAIAIQSGAKVLDVSQVSIDPTLVSKVPQSLARERRVFPFALEGNVLKIATANPFDVLTRDALARRTGCQIEPYLAPQSWISSAIDLHYYAAQTIDKEIDRIAQLELEGSVVGENQIIRLADLLVEKGVVLGASDIHIVPDTKLVRVFYRIDGVLHQEYLFPIKFQPNIVSRYKIMGDMDISNPNIPHDGRIKYSSSVGDLDLRVSTFPTHLGETVVLRLLVHSKVVGDLERLGLEAEDLAVFLRSLHRPYGLILTTGPTGAGKTTTLYSALMKIAGPTVNAMTIEDPIEYVIPNIRQTAVNPKAGLTFANALRSAMRQDPDTILVGEIRDQETAELALRAALTGHLVLSTLHTNDASSAIHRLLDLGVNASILASSLVLVVAQRLLRRICPQCHVLEPIRPDEREIFASNRLTAPELLPRAVGCASCYNTGYKGRIGVYEVLPISREIEELIFEGAIASRIEDVAIKNGVSLLKNQALKKAAQQVTTIEEVFRVVA